MKNNQKQLDKQTARTVLAVAFGSSELLEETYDAIKIINNVEKAGIRLAEVETSM
jgi:hypothetical protein